jgi:hypothetical protein
MTRTLCITTLTLLLFACAAEEPAPAPAEPATASTASTPAATPAPAAAPEEPLPDHDVTGSYMPIEPLTGEFAELEHLLLATIDENAAPSPLNGFLRPKEQAAPDYRLVNPSMTGKKLTFVTMANDGVHYTFDGQFLVLGKFSENPPTYETTVLTGTLQRVRNGQTVASTPVKFRYEAGG